MPAVDTPSTPLSIVESQGSLGYLDNELSPSETVYLWHNPLTTEVPDGIISPYAGEGFMDEQFNNFINENALFGFELQQYEN